MPRMPDARIPLSGLGGGGGGGDQPQGFGVFQGPMQTLGALMKIKEARQQAEEKQRALDDDNAMRETLQRYDRPDEAIDDLYKQGRSTVAGTLAKHVYDQRKAEQDAYEKQLKNTGSRMEMATQIAQGMTDEQSFQNGRKAIVELLHPIFGQGIEDQLGTNYDEARMKKVLAYGTTRVEELKRRQDAVTNVREALRLQGGGTQDPVTGEFRPLAPGEEDPGAGGEMGKNRVAAMEKWNAGISQGLSTANSKGEWDTMMRTFHGQGAPISILKQYGDWDPKAKERAAQLGISPKDRETIAHQATQEEQQNRRLNLEERRVREYESRDGGTGTGTPKGITATSVYNSRRERDNENQAIEKWVRERDQVKKGPKDENGKEQPLAWGLNNMSDEDQQEYIRRRLQVENDHRTQIGMQSLEDTAAAAAEKGDVAGYNKI